MQFSSYIFATGFRHARSHSLNISSFRSLATVLCLKTINISPSVFLDYVRTKSTSNLLTPIACLSILLHTHKHTLASHSSSLSSEPGRAGQKSYHSREHDDLRGRRPEPAPGLREHRRRQLVLHRHVVLLLGALLGLLLLPQLLLVVLPAEGGAPIGVEGALWRCHGVQNVTQVGALLLYPDLEEGQTNTVRPRSGTESYFGQGKLGKQRLTCWF